MQRSKRKARPALLLVAAALAGAGAGRSQTAITIYNQNLALVHEQRQMQVARGRSEVSYPAVAAQIDPTSVKVEVKNAPESLNILEQNFEFDLVSGDKIFEKYLEKPITLVTKNNGAVRGTLLSSSGGAVVLQQENGALQVVASGEVLSTEFPALPGGLRSKPTLVWLVDNQGTQSRELEVSYLTRGVDWHAEYVGVLSEDERQLEVNGWASIENRSGASYENARLKLVAGDINLVPDELPRPQLARMMEAVSQAPEMQEREFFEYHLYDLQRPATLRDNQQKQVTLLPQAVTPVEKVFVYDSQRDPRRVAVTIRFKNAKSRGLGMALPGGKFRLYKSDVDGALLFLGEDRIQHTPKEEEVRLTIGKAFDIVAERQQTADRSLGRNTREQSFELKLRNHKAEAAAVTVVEHFRGDWSIIQSSLPPARKNAMRAEWELEIPPGQEAALTFTVLLKW